MSPVGGDKSRTGRGGKKLGPEGGMSGGAALQGRTG